MTTEVKHTDEAFTQLVIDNQSRIYGYIYGLVHNASDTEDVLQSTLMSLWGRFGDFEHGTDFCAWAIATARFEILRFNQNRKESSAFSEDLINQLSVHFSTDAEVDSARREALQACVKDLSSADQGLLDRRYFKGQKVKDIAADLDRSERSLSNSLSRIRGWLFECVRRRMAQEAHS